MITKRAAIFMGIMTFLWISAISAETTANVTDVTTNKTDTGNKVDPKGFSFSTDFIVCAVLGVILTVIAIIACVYIKKKGEASGYASGGNIPKPLAGLSDDF